MTTVKFWRINIGQINILTLRFKNIINSKQKLNVNQFTGFIKK